MTKLMNALMPLVLLLPLMAQAESVPRKDSELETALQRAMATNPEILLAEAKLQEAKAALMIARAKVAEEVVAFVHERRLIQSKMATASLKAARVHKLHSAGNVSDAEVLEADEVLIELKAQLARLEARVRFRGGQDPAGGAMLRGREVRPSGATTAPADRSTIPEELRRDLNVRLKINLGGSLQTVVKQIFDTSVRVVYDRSLDPSFQKNVPAMSTAFFSGTREQALWAVADVMEIAFIVRPYGLFVTTLEKARNYRSPTIPTGLGR